MRRCKFYRDYFIRRVLAICLDKVYIFTYMSMYMYRFGLVRFGLGSGGLGLV